MYRSPVASDLKSFKIRVINGVFIFLSLTFIISNLMHGSNQHASYSPAVKSPRKPSVVFFVKMSRDKRKGWSCQMLTQRNYMDVIEKEQIIDSSILQTCVPSLEHFGGAGT